MTFFSSAGLAAEPAAESASAASAAIDRMAELARDIDVRWPARDQGDNPAAIEKDAGEIVASEAPGFEAAWRAARWFFWVADGMKDLDEAAKVAERGWHIGEVAVQKAPERIEGQYFTAICIGVYSQSLGVLKALAKGIEGKFITPLDKAIAIDSGFESSGPLVSKGRYYFKLPWPKYDAKKSIEILGKALEQHPKNLRARLYLAETQLEEGNAKEAKRLLDEIVDATPGAYDAPEERRIQPRAKALFPKVIEALK